MCAPSRSTVHTRDSHNTSSGLPPSHVPRLRYQQLAGIRGFALLPAVLRARPALARPTAFDLNLRILPPSPSRPPLGAATALPLPHVGSTARSAPTARSARSPTIPFVISTHSDSFPPLLSTLSPISAIYVPLVLNFIATSISWPLYSVLHFTMSHLLAFHVLYVLYSIFLDKTSYFEPFFCQRPIRQRRSIARLGFNSHGRLNL